ncbi:MAG: Fic family protein [Bryobacteraceae bacterium]
MYTCAGNFRTGPVNISGTTHQPPPASEIAEHVEDMCDYVNAKWETTSALHLASYLMWKVNWIHPFAGGNGRTSRAASYLVLCARLGYRLPGTNTIPEQIIANRQPYYGALDAADAAWTDNRIDLAAIEQLLSELLANQLSSVIEAAGAPTDRTG